MFKHNFRGFGSEGGFGGRRGGRREGADCAGEGVNFGPHGMRGGEGFGRRGFGGRNPFGHDEGHGGPRGRRGRMFEGGELRLVMLLLIEQAPRHGYDIIRELETRTGGAYAPSPGVVYPTLTLLEETGLVEAQASEGAKRLFAITPAGKQELDNNRADAEAALARLEALRKRGEATDMGPVFRAMINLKTVLQQKALDAGNKQQLLDVADIIDEAARKIERL
jgi:DNA-binding PadR family transcriptional regulator